MAPPCSRPSWSERTYGQRPRHGGRVGLLAEICAISEVRLIEVYPQDFNLCILDRERGSLRSRHLQKIRYCAAEFRSATRYGAYSRTV
jgi:hypothetical protein